MTFRVCKENVENRDLMDLQVTMGYLDQMDHWVL